MKISAVALGEGEILFRRRSRYGPRYAGGFCPAEFMLMQISAQGFAVASVASVAMPDGRGDVGICFVNSGRRDPGYSFQEFRDDRRRGGRIEGVIN
jgi:hypothetical protein